MTLTDVVPTGTTFVSFTAPPGWTSTTPAPGGTGTITATRPTFTSFDNIGFTLIVHVNSSSGTTLQNTASVSSATPDPVPGNNSAVESTSVSQSADLSVIKADTPIPSRRATT